MLRDQATIKGTVSATVFGPDGQPKRRDKLTTRQFFKALFHARTWAEFKRMLRFEYAINHNIVTDQGDALVADAMSAAARTPVDNTNGQITVGTGWTGTNTKQNTGVNTPTGSAEIMDATYPKLKGTWGAGDDNVVQYRVTYEAGDLNANGIDEAALGNGTDNLAYGQITPDVNVSTLDTLQIDWEITFLGA